MNSRMLIPLLLLSLLIHHAQAMRFIRIGSLPVTQQSITNKALMEMTNEDDLIEEANSKSKHFWGRARKLMNTSTIPTATSITDENEKKGKNKEKTGRKEEDLWVDSQRRPAAHETYPDILDLAGMDYSQARRKPPIHN